MQIYCLRRELYNLEAQTRRSTPWRRDKNDHSGYWLQLERENNNNNNFKGLYRLQITESVDLNDTPKNMMLLVESCQISTWTSKSCVQGLLRLLDPRTPSHFESWSQSYHDHAKAYCFVVWLQTLRRCPSYGCTRIMLRCNLEKWYYISLYMQW